MNALEKLIKEYRPSMDAEVLHSWAADLLASLSPAIPGKGMEPVAWKYELANYINPDRSYTGWDRNPRLSFEKPEVPEGSIRNLVPLYASPAFAQETEPAIKWRKVAGFEEAYEVSSDGDVRNIKTGKLLAKNLMGLGYVKAELWASNKRTQTSVHRVVAEAFLPRPEGATEVNHKDGDKTNNQVGNLEWTDRKGNTEHSMYVLGNNIKPVLAIGEDGSEEYYPSIEDAGRHGYATSKVYDVLYGLKERHGGKRWVFTTWRGPTPPLATPPAEAAPVGVKQIAVKFFRWWWNQPGANTDEGFDEWAKSEGAPLLAALAPAKADTDAIEATPNYLPAVEVHSAETLPSGDEYLISKAFVHEGAIIALYGTNDKLIGWIDTNAWTKGRVYRDQLLSAAPSQGVDPPIPYAQRHMTREEREAFESIKP